MQIINVKTKSIFVTIFTGSEYEDPDDPTVIAENELIGAAMQIGMCGRRNLQ